MHCITSQVMLSPHMNVHITTQGMPATTHGTLLSHSATTASAHPKAHAPKKKTRLVIPHSFGRNCPCFEPKEIPSICIKPDCIFVLD